MGSLRHQAQELLGLLLILLFFSQKVCVYASNTNNKCGILNGTKLLLEAILIPGLEKDNFSPLHLYNRLLQDKISQPHMLGLD